jgi:hypothetical protein
MHAYQLAIFRPGSDTPETLKCQQLDELLTLVVAHAKSATPWRWMILTPVSEDMPGERHE